MVKDSQVLNPPDNVTQPRDTMSGVITNNKRKKHMTTDQGSDGYDGPMLKTINDMYKHPWYRSGKLFYVNILYFNHNQEHVDITYLHSSSWKRRKE